MMPTGQIMASKPGVTVSDKWLTMIITKYGLHWSLYTRTRLWVSRPLLLASRGELPQKRIRKTTVDLQKKLNRLCIQF